MNIYVASSWKNERLDSVIETLRREGFGVYDFRADGGFHWSEIGVTSAGDTTKNFIDGITSQRANEHFYRDFQAMVDADVCVLVLPCNKSAHLELGWFTGMGKKTLIFLESGEVVPELMYKLADCITEDFLEVIDTLHVFNATGDYGRSWDFDDDDDEYDYEDDYDEDDEDDDEFRG